MSRNRKRLAIHGGPPVRTAPWPRWPFFGDEEKTAACRTIDSQWIVAHHNPAGPGEVEAFEKAFASWIGMEHVVGVGNGTEGLHLALAAAEVGVNDEVIVPTFTFLATATSVMMNNAVPVFVDCEPDTLGLDPAEVEKHITPRTKAIISVHVCGYPCEMDELVRVARRHNLVVIDDCSHAHGATYHGRKIGTLGDINVFSLQQKKILCVGDGGLVVTNNPAYADAIRKMRTFQHDELSYNYRMTEIAAAIGQVRLKHLEAQNRQRRENADFLEQALADVPGIRVRKPAPDTEGVYYSLLMDYHAAQVGLSRAEFVKAVQAEGAPVDRCFYTPVHRHPNFHPRKTPARGCPWQWALYTAPPGERPSYDDGACPVAERAMDEYLIDMKISPPVTTNDMADVAAAIRKVVENAGELKPAGVPR